MKPKRVRMPIMQKFAMILQMQWIILKSDTKIVISTNPLEVLGFSISQKCKCIRNYQTLNDYMCKGLCVNLVLVNVDLLGVFICKRAWIKSILVNFCSPAIELKSSTADKGRLSTTLYELYQRHMMFY